MPLARWRLPSRSPFLRFSDRTEGGHASLGSGYHLPGEGWWPTWWHGVRRWLPGSHNLPLVVSVGDLGGLVSYHCILYFRFLLRAQ